MSCADIFDESKKPIYVLRAIPRQSWNSEVSGFYVYCKEIDFDFFCCRQNDFWKKLKMVQLDSLA